METWYTQPKNSFASFYYFQEEDRILIRIRLELNRNNKGDTKAIYGRNRYYGFTDKKLNTDGKYYTIINGIVNYGGQELQDTPEVGKNVYDFSSDDGIKPKTAKVHYGNKVSEDPVLPDSITEDQLIRLAELTIENGESIVLTKSDASSEELTEAILNAIS